MYTLTIHSTRTRIGHKRTYIIVGSSEQIVPVELSWAYTATGLRDELARLVKKYQPKLNQWKTEAE